MLTRDEVLKIAKLARLELSEDEVAFYQNRLGRVLDYMTELKAVETSKDAFVRHVPLDAEPFREDISESFGGRDALLKNAPALEEEGFLLPAILESE
ncbi:MAG: Asp-tRNA(Asn)/Glu-tRNA(Gln) amidotransferase subunit GatC [Proteobacteria bacterium]|nr:Asp-tRNA(Asn)/Glu-tRNA(Gln) amidotransferase subunit GatC [Pseudomonadota bacterium]NDC23709.1 Asp-tRNA(Asn)/Glu-tRNA(Gln) amidotransferase subunit GatC [Pseudomonadota bacterium]NDD03954.1 Asp-tRNA(Asn)/Glu-tRNA(Gln) amidotransferase subunit GatC [Pseudomonadota bacterium]NDG26688.1 Asp-tRNA(Asn)/Glu-tRNA(Gln) amidotransferase subunit GatC [Pseudomonadota bacterium]